MDKEAVSLLGMDLKVGGRSAARTDAKQTRNDSKCNTVRIVEVVEAADGNFSGGRGGSQRSLRENCRSIAARWVSRNDSFRLGVLKKTSYPSTIHLWGASQNKRKLAVITLAVTTRIL